MQPTWFVRLGGCPAVALSHRLILNLLLNINSFPPNRLFAI